MRENESSSSNRCLLMFTEYLIGVYRCLRNALCFFRHEASSRVESAVWSPRGRENESSSSNRCLLMFTEYLIISNRCLQVFTECTSTESKSSTRLFKFSNFRDQYLLWRLLNGTIKIVLIKLTLGDADYVEQFARLYGPYLLTLGWFWSFYVRRIRSGVVYYWPPFLLFLS